MLEIHKLKETINKYLPELQLYKQSINNLASDYNDVLNNLPVNFNEQILASTILPKNFQGALLTDEYFENKQIIIPYNYEYHDKQSLQDWKSQILLNRITGAVDGSHIMPNKDTDLFFGIIQASEYLNYHCTDTPYYSENILDFAIPDINTSQADFIQEINYKRFNLEIQSLCNLIEYIAKNYIFAENTKLPILFFDGSLIESNYISSPYYHKYKSAINNLITVSEQHQIPVIGYIDNPQSYNLGSSLYQVCNIHQEPINITDNKLLTPYLKQWGNRTCLFEIYNNRDFGFLYINNNNDNNYSARLEIPLWINSTDINLNEIINVVLAESIVGNGYIYPIEAADSCAVLRHAEQDYILNYLINNYNDLLNITKSSKSVSKQNRRQTSIYL